MIKFQMLPFLGFLFLLGCASGVRDLEVRPQTSEQTSVLPLSIQSPNAVFLRSSTNPDPLLKVHALLLAFYSTDSGNEVLLRTEEVRVQDESDLSELNVKVPKANYKLVVVANPTEKIRERLKPGASLNRLTMPEKVSADGLMRQIEGGALAVSMFNDQGVLDIAETDFSDAAANLSKRHRVSLEPSLARVLVYGEPELKGGTKGSEPARYLINNVARQVALLRPLNKLSSGEQEVAGDGSARERRYASGRLWSLWHDADPTNLAGEIANHNLETYRKRSWQSIQHTAEEYTTHLADNALYAKETAIPPRAYLQGSVPCVVVAYPYVPKGLTLTEGEGWVSYQGVYYRESEFKTFLSGTTEVEASLRQAIERAHLTEASFSEAFSKEGIDFYHKALSYYVIYIRHFSEATNVDAYGRYGLIRGNEYRIRLVSVQAQGQATPPLLEGNQMPIVEKAHTGLVVDIAPLAVRNQDETL